MAVSVELKLFGGSLSAQASEEGLVVKSEVAVDWNQPESWPTDASESSSGRRTAFEIASLLEMGLANWVGDAVAIPYANFSEIEAQDFRITTAFADPSPFLLKIDRTSDIGRPNFRYRYQFIFGTQPVPVLRLGFFVKRTTQSEVYRLDETMFSLLEAMDRFNALPPEEKGQQRSWLDFASIKRWARETDARLDATLLNNDVVVPSSIGLDLYEDGNGALSFIPTCPELEDSTFRTVFERNNEAEGFYSLDQPGMGKLRIVLTDRQQAVLERMKRVQRVTGLKRETLRKDPRQIFDGIVGDVELPYGDRVLGIGTYEFDPVPGKKNDEGIMGRLFDGTAPVTAAKDKKEFGTSLDDQEAASPAEKKTLLIDTHGEFVRQDYLDQSESARLEANFQPFVRPASLLDHIELKNHQKDGVAWLQNCTRIENRQGVLLADDMGVGKTLQILAFLSWCIESGRFPDLSRAKPPFRPILIVAPLILLETETWGKEMAKFFTDKGEIFGNVLPLYGHTLKGFRRKDAEGREAVIAKPILDLDRIRRHQVVITNYEAVRDYEFSFAYFPDGKSLWTVVITDEAQEFKTPNSKISHAIKALKPEFRVACTGTPVENRLLDLWNLFDAVQPGLLGPAKEFAAKYEDSAADGSLADLKARLLYGRPHTFLLRRSKDEVLELPRKHDHKLLCVMSPGEVAIHKSLSSGIGVVRQSKGKLDLLHRFARASQHPLLLESAGDEFSVQELREKSAKLQEVLKVLHQVRAVGEKAIVFARHKDVQRMLSRVFGVEFGRPVRVINGDTARSTSSARLGGETRLSILRDFRETQGFNIIILSPFVAGVGLTIVEANHVIHYGRWWNPAVESQATDRAYRLGQGREVHVYFPILVDRSKQLAQTFDQALDALMDDKKGVAAGALSREDFLKPQISETDAGLQVFETLESSLIS